MISVCNISKNYEDVKVFENYNLLIEDGKATIIIGENGAGKSTLLKLIAGIIKVDKGEIKLDDKIIFENAEAKSNIFYLPDDLHYAYSSINEMIDFYRKYYNNFDIDFAKKLFTDFNLDIRRPIKKFSKGMKKQASFLMAISAKTKYLLSDEVFDGVDKNAKEKLITLINNEMRERNFTPVFTTHNINEMMNLDANVVTIERARIGEIKNEE